MTDNAPWSLNHNGNCASRFTGKYPHTEELMYVEGNNDTAMYDIVHEIMGGKTVVSSHKKEIKAREKLRTLTKKD